MDARVWWVNHPHTCRYEVAGGYIWFGRKGARSQSLAESERSLRRFAPGDLVFSFAEGVVGAVGVVLSAARAAVKPAEFAAVVEHAGVDAGWQVSVRFMSLAKGLRVKDHADALGPVIPKKHSPIRTNGGWNHHVHVAAVPPQMAAVVRRLLGGELERIVETISDALGISHAEQAAEAVIESRGDIGPMQKSTLLMARQGQGVFRTVLESHEQGCRVTGVLDRRHLRATHIKPWVECNDEERLDGSNGLLLSPHIAHLFDRGYLSFADDGALLVSSDLNPAVVAGWCIDPSRNVGPFTPAQCKYLQYHRGQVFGRRGGGGRRVLVGNIDAVPPISTAEPAVVEPA